MKITLVAPRPLRGSVNPPPDKSISHRAVIIASLSGPAGQGHGHEGLSTIENLLPSEDVEATLNWARAIGAQVNIHKPAWSVSNCNRTPAASGGCNLTIKGIGALPHTEVLPGCQPKGRLTVSAEAGSLLVPDKTYCHYLGNSGTSARLLLGASAGLGGRHIFWGDSSLNKRPMLRVAQPLQAMGVQLEASPNILTPEQVKSFGEQLPKRVQPAIISAHLQAEAYLPLSIVSCGPTQAIEYQLPMPSAQVKSAILLAGLYSSGVTSVIEREPTRDHTENMLRAAGVEVNTFEKCFNNSLVKVISLPQGPKYLRPQAWSIPGDFSSAAFLMVAALLVPGSDITLQNVNLNPLRTGLLQVLLKMGANIEVTFLPTCCSEPCGNLRVQFTPNLQPALVNSDIVATLIDELPILFCLASTISGVSKFYGIKELRFKESDRIATVARNLENLGVATQATADSLTIEGDSFKLDSSLEVDACLDHRIALSFSVLSLKLAKPIVVRGARTIKTSYPNFIEHITHLGANIVE